MRQRAPQAVRLGRLPRDLRHREHERQLLPARDLQLAGRGVLVMRRLGIIATGLLLLSLAIAATVIEPATVDAKAARAAGIPAAVPLSQRPLTQKGLELGVEHT